jgi:hypothetical protein
MKAFVKLTSGFCRGKMRSARRGCMPAAYRNNCASDFFSGSCRDTGPPGPCNAAELPGTQELVQGGAPWMTIACAKFRSCMPGPLVQGPFSPASRHPLKSPNNQNNRADAGAQLFSPATHSCGGSRGRIVCKQETAACRRRLRFPG